MAYNSSYNRRGGYGGKGGKGRGGKGKGKNRYEYREERRVQWHNEEGTLETFRLMQNTCWVKANATTSDDILTKR